MEGEEPEPVHQLLAATLDTCYDRIREIQADARKNGVRPAAMAHDRHADAKGMDGAKGSEWPARRGHVRAHQVPLDSVEGPRAA